MRTRELWKALGHIPTVILKVFKSMIKVEVQPEGVRESVEAAAAMGAKHPPLQQQLMTVPGRHQGRGVGPLPTPLLPSPNSQRGLNAPGRLQPPSPALPLAPLLPLALLWVQLPLKCLRR